MASQIDITAMDTMSLLEHLILLATERGILIADGAPDEELSTAQKKVDTAQLELTRRIAW